MRVLSLIDSLAPGGAERSLVELSPHLRELGIDHAVAVLHDRPGYRDELTDSGTTVTTVGGDRLPARLRALRALTDDVDLLHTTLHDADVLGRVALLGRSTPIVCTLANVRYGPEQRAEPGLVRWKVEVTRAVDIVTARRVTRFHAVSQSVATQMARTLHVPSARMVVVPRGRDAQRLGRRLDDRRAVARRELGVDPDQPVVLCVARHEHQKGLDVLTEAAIRLRTDRPSLKVLVAGSEGRRTDDLRRAIRDADLDATVELLGARDDVPELLCAADVFVLPSRREGFPGAVVEAMALETPLVVSDIPMTHEAVPDDTMARFVPVDAPEALADAIADTLDDPSGSRARASRARQRFEERFTIEATAAQMAALFHDAAGGPTPPITARS